MSEDKGKVSYTRSIWRRYRPALGGRGAHVKNGRSRGLLLTCTDGSEVARGSHVRTRRLSEVPRAYTSCWGFRKNGYPQRHLVVGIGDYCPVTGIGASSKWSRLNRGNSGSVSLEPKTKFCCPWVVLHLKR